LTIQSVSIFTPGLAGNGSIKESVTPYSAQKSFAEQLKKAIATVNEAQIQSDALTEKLARGEDVELHQVMIAAEKASITLQLATEIRNKAIEAYREIMNMQI